MTARKTPRPASQPDPCDRFALLEIGAQHYHLLERREISWTVLIDDIHGFDRARRILDALNAHATEQQTGDTP